MNINTITKEIRQQESISRQGKGDVNSEKLKNMNLQKNSQNLKQQNQQLIQRLSIMKANVTKSLEEKNASSRKLEELKFQFQSLQATKQKEEEKLQRGKKLHDEARKELLEKAKKTNDELAKCVKKYDHKTVKETIQRIKTELQLANSEGNPETKKDFENFKRENVNLKKKIENLQKKLTNNNKDKGGIENKNELEEVKKKLNSIMELKIEKEKELDHGKNERKRVIEDFRNKLKKKMICSKCNNSIEASLEETYGK